ncbi:hypothetical protein [Mucilaginibacter sp.]|uniref:hypothetical protein n=1 Tax=Mucilaginibacter sp. TaxID=1882438 RepID=UPI002634E67D|nr:hypothetical protein [Mucilaginibacter sp.]MDB4922114.1 hypothetical protein [Mucilaginibacter sp.]
MAIAQKSHTELNAIQVSLLRLFNRPMSEKNTLTLKRLLVNHFSDLLKEEVTDVLDKKGYTQMDFDEMLNSND